MPLKRILLASLMLFFTSFTSGCTSVSVDPGTPEYAAAIKSDRASLQGDSGIPESIALSIDEALEVAVQQNLDARVAALEHLSAAKEITLENIKALPSMKYTVARNGRSNTPASSSLSVLTGQQSLEPSASQEKFRSTRDISVNWNIIDSASALMQGRAASDRSKIAQERYRKVVQNIHRDVYAAYWQAAAGGKTDAETNRLIEHAQTHIEKIDEAAKQKLISKTEANLTKLPYLQGMATLEALKNETDLAKIELKSLLNVPQSTKLVLTSKPSGLAKLSSAALKQNFEALELAALSNRPEMHEAFINKNISIRQTKEEIIRTIPGTELFYALNQDTNKFLSNNSWKTYSISLVQNITSLLSFPDRYLASRKNEDLSEARRITMAAAIMAQVHIARHGLVHAKKRYQVTAREKIASEQQAFAALKKQHAGHASKGDTLLAKIRAHEKALEYFQSLSGFYESYAAFVNTLGFDVGDDISMKKAVTS